MKRRMPGSITESTIQRKKNSMDNEDIKKTSTVSFGIKMDEELKKHVKDMMSDFLKSRAEQLFDENILPGWGSDIAMPQEFKEILLQIFRCGYLSGWRDHQHLAKERKV